MESFRRFHTITMRAGARTDMGSVSAIEGPGRVEWSFSTVASLDAGEEKHLEHILKKEMHMEHIQSRHSPGQKTSASCTRASGIKTQFATKAKMWDQSYHDLATHAARLKHSLHCGLAMPRQVHEFPLILILIRSLRNFEVLHAACRR